MGTIVVTGAARGMGLACARRLRSGDDQLVLADLDETALRDVCAELGAIPVACDVTDRRSVVRLADEAARHEPVRAIVHAAGISPTMATWDRICDVDLRGTALVLEALDPLVGAGSAAVCFASTAAPLVAGNGDPTIDAVLDDPGADDLLARLDALGDPRITDPTGAYGWSKRGVIRLVRRTAIAWGPRRARINSVSPGLIDTPMGQEELSGQPVMGAVVAHTPLGRLGLASEVADLVAFLLSEQASYITGSDVVIDGGMVPGFLGG
jgi:NAD(P)-dependent dehydrogenase (short-subunit alcohol dehydrogenase family)